MFFYYTSLAENFTVKVEWEAEPSAFRLLSSGTSSQFGCSQQTSSLLLRLGFKHSFLISWLALQTTPSFFLVTSYDALSSSACFTPPPSRLFLSLVLSQLKRWFLLHAATKCCSGGLLAFSIYNTVKAFIIPCNVLWVDFKL